MDLTEPTIVEFRVWRAEPHGVLALFPEEPERDGYVSSYEHIGQHGRANYNGCMRLTRPASPDEYASLKTELERLGYKLDVRQRRPG